MRRTDFSKFGLAVLAAIIAGGAVSAAFTQDAQSTQQDQPSVADAARAATAAKKDKEKSSAPKTVITEDSLGSGAVSSKAVGGGAAAAGTASGTVATATAGDTPSGEGSASLDAAWARLQATESTLDRFEPLGKSEVAATVLGGNTGDFPGRAEWEEKMYTEKTTYVARSRQLILAMKEALLQMAQMNSGDQKLSSHDPRVVSLTRKTTQLMQLAAKTEAEFQGVVSEGRALAQAGK